MLCSQAACRVVKPDAVTSRRSALHHDFAIMYRFSNCEVSTLLLHS